MYVKQNWPFIILIFAWKGWTSWQIKAKIFLFTILFRRNICCLLLYVINWIGGYFVTHIIQIASKFVVNWFLIQNEELVNVSFIRKVEKPGDKSRPKSSTQQFFSNITAAVHNTSRIRSKIMSWLTIDLEFRLCHELQISLVNVTMLWRIILYSGCWRCRNEFSINVGTCRPLSFLKLWISRWNLSLQICKGLNCV